jgi:hypothetical protein
LLRPNEGRLNLPDALRSVIPKWLDGGCVDVERVEEVKKKRNGCGWMELDAQ